MEIGILNRELRKQAVAHGLCDKWQEQWQQNWKREKMVEKMFEGIDFCLQYNYPTNDFIKENFDCEFRRKSNVIIDDKWSLLNPENALIGGASSTTIRYNARHHGQVYVKDNAIAKILASGNAFVMVHCLGSCQVKIEKSDDARVIIINHSPNSVIIAEKEIEIREEFDWLK